MAATGRVVIVGAGLGALYAALVLAPRPVLMISPDPVGQGASSAWAQGGVAAAIAAPDSAGCHAADTVRAGAGTVDPAIAALVTEEARAHILELTRLGAPFDRDAAGGYVLSREAAHSFARVVRVKGDQAGAEIMRALVAAVRAAPSVQVLEGWIATGLEVVAGRVTGLRLALAAGSAEVALTAPAVLIAGGGSGGLYAVTTNPPRIRGETIGLAARAGAVIADAEFVQFHPTAIAIAEDPAPLATEALRGEGAQLIDAAGRRFMPALHPEAELAPRDIVARGVYAETQAGRSPALDCRMIPDLAARFPAVAAACARVGIDPTRQPIPVAAAAHYHMGGIATDSGGRASLPGLWACGEAGSTGLHGANRLASNGLLEALVFARRAALSIAAETAAGDPAPVALPHCAPGPLPDPALIQRLRCTMTAGAGVLRDAAGLRASLREIALIEAARPHPQLHNMTATATMICAAALSRRESRGAHCRTDFPASLPEAVRSRMTLTEALALRAAAHPEPEPT